MTLPTKDQIEQTKNLLSIGQILVVAIGVLVVFSYCASEQVTPDGLSLGDAFFLIWIALGFGFLMIVGTLFGMLAALYPVKWYIGFINRLNKNRTAHELSPLLNQLMWPMISILLIMGVAVGVALAIYSKNTPDWGVLRTCGFFVCFGAMLLLFCFSQDKNRQQIRVGKTLSSLAIAVLMFISSVALIKPELLNYTMRLMGIRSDPGALLIISQADHEHLAELAKESGIAVEFCKLPQSSRWGTIDARAVWNGIGSTSYIQLLDHGEDGRRNLLVPIIRANLEVVRPSKLSLTCKGTLGFIPEVARAK